MTDKFNKVLDEIIKGLGEFAKLESKFNDLKKEVEALQQAEKQPEIEEQIFDRIKEYYKGTGLITRDYIAFKGHFNNTDSKKEYKQTMFLAIMQAVHILIEGKERKFEATKRNYVFFYHAENKKIVSECWQYSKYTPDFFYFSTSENRDLAIEILSNFFGVNLINWWVE